MLESIKRKRSKSKQKIQNQRRLRIKGINRDKSVSLKIRRNRIILIQILIAVSIRPTQQTSNPTQISHNQKEEARVSKENMADGSTEQDLGSHDSSPS